jgi:membrane protein
MPTDAWRAVLVRCFSEASADNLGLISAGVAFYSFLALAPLLGATLLTYGLFVEPQSVVDHIGKLSSFLPEEVASTIGVQLLRLTAAPDSGKGLGLFIALAIALFGARNGIGAVMTALNIAYEEEERRGIIHLNFVAILLTAAAIACAGATALALAGLAAVLAILPPDMRLAATLIGVLTHLLLGLVGAAVAACLLRYGPCRRQAKWVWLTPGSILAAGAWLALALGFGTYARTIGHFDATYGPLGAVAALLTWVYLASYALLIGAELNSELEHQTEIDSTRGAPRTRGRRGAWVADHVAGEP